MNICFVEFGYPSEEFGGGAGTYVQLTAKELVRRGHKTFVISKYLDGGPEEFMDDGVLIKRIKIKGWHWYLSKIPLIGKIAARFFKIIESSIAINSAIKKLHKNDTLDLVEFSETANFLYLLQIRLPYIVNLHGSSFTFKKYCGEKITPEDRLQRMLEGFFMEKADWITSASKFLKEEIMHEFNIADSKIQVIPYPVDERLLALPLKHKQDTKIIFYAGRLEKRKGVHILKEAIPAVIEEYPDVKFVLFGSDSKEITSEALKNYFKQHEIADKVEVRGFIPKEKMFDYLAQADICVVPSLWDNSPNTVYEAMAAGKAVVASNTGGIPELMNNGVTGMLVEKENPDALIFGIITLLRNDNVRETMGKKARDAVVGKDSIVEKRLEIYRRITKKTQA